MRTLFTALALMISAPVAPMAAAELAETAGLTALADSLKSVGTADAAFIRRTMIRKKRTTGYVAVVVVGDDAEGAVDSVDLTIQHGPEDAAPLGGVTTCDEGGNCATLFRLRPPPSGENKRFRFNDNFNYNRVVPSGTGFAMTATMRGPDGQQVGEGFSATVVVVEPGDVRIRSVTIRQIDDVNFRLKAVIVDDLDNEIDQVFVTFDDYEGPDPEPDDSFAITDPKIKDNGNKVFKNNTLMFSDPAAAEDQVYTVVIDLRGGVTSLGSSFHQVVVEGLEQANGVNQCADGIRNGAETAIDCGGDVCGPCEVDDLLNELDWAWTIADFYRAREAAFSAEFAGALELFSASVDERDAAIAADMGISVDELLASYGSGKTLIDNVVITSHGDAPVEPAR